MLVAGCSRLFCVATTNQARVQSLLLAHTLDESSSLLCGQLSAGDGHFLSRLSYLYHAELVVYSNPPSKRCKFFLLEFPFFNKDSRTLMNPSVAVSNLSPNLYNSSALGCLSRWTLFSSNGSCRSTCFSTPCALVPSMQHRREKCNSFHHAKSGRSLFHHVELFSVLAMRRFLLLSST